MNEYRRTIQKIEREKAQDKRQKEPWLFMLKYGFIQPTVGSHFSRIDQPHWIPFCFLLYTLLMYLLFSYYFMLSFCVQNVFE